MKRDEGCKGCSWNFGEPTFPCTFCDEYALDIDITEILENAEIQEEDN